MVQLEDQNEDIIVYKIAGRAFFPAIFFAADKKREQNE